MRTLASTLAHSRARARVLRLSSPRPSRAVVRASSADDESIEALESRLKNKRAGAPGGKDRTDARSAPTTTGNKGKNPAFGYFDTAAKNSRVRAGANGMLSSWEGDPDEWDASPVAKRAGVLWTGEKGWMYWMNQASLYGAAAIAFAWVVFRFVGPALGVYELR